MDSVGDDIDAALQNLETLLLEGDIDRAHKSFAAAKSAAKKPSYKTFFRNAEAYETEAVYFKGEVIQVIYNQPWGGSDCLSQSRLLDGDATILRVDVTYEGYGFYKDTVYVAYLGSKRVIEDDIIEFVGAGTGLQSYESTLGATITIPSVVVGRWLVIR